MVWKDEVVDCLEVCAEEGDKNLKKKASARIPDLETWTTAFPNVKLKC